MAEAEGENRKVNEASEVTDAKKRKGFFSKVFNKDQKKDDQEPKKGGLMNSLMDNARQAATKEVAHLAENEAKKAIHDNGSQPTNSNNNNNTTSGLTPDAQTTSPSDALNATTSWAKRMVGNAQQKIQGL